MAMLERRVLQFQSQLTHVATSDNYKQTKSVCRYKMHPINRVYISVFNSHAKLPKKQQQTHLFATEVNSGKNIYPATFPNLVIIQRMSIVQLDRALMVSAINNHKLFK